MIKQVLLAGGEGKRVQQLLSMPKQFCKLIGKDGKKYSTFMLALERTRLVYEIEDIIIVVNFKYIEIAIEQIEEVFFSKNKSSSSEDSAGDPSKIMILIEKEANNTMLAIYQVLNFIKEYYIDEKDVLIIPSDNLIFDLENYYMNFKEAINFHKEISIFGVDVENFDDSYKYGNIICNQNNEVLCFYEKPDLGFLKSVLNENTYKHLWSIGSFILNIDFILEKMLQIFKINYEIQFISNKKLEKIDFPIEKIFILNNNMEDLLKIPFDFLIPHVLKSLKVFECNFDWVDIGSPEKIRELVS